MSFDRLEKVRLLSIVVCLIGLFVGKSDFSRIAGLGAILPGIEVRLLCAVASSAALIFWSFRSTGAKRINSLGTSLLLAGPWAALLFYNIIGIRYFWPTGSYNETLIDILYVIVFTTTMAFSVQSIKDMRAAAIAIQFTAAVVFTASLLKIGPKSYSYNYGEIVTTTTMYRIYGAGLCSSVFLLRTDKRVWAWSFQILLSIAFTFAILSSTSKTSVIAIASVAAAVFMISSVYGRWKDILIVGVIIVCGVTAFLNVGSPQLLTDRIADFGENSVADLGSDEPSQDTTLTCDPKAVSVLPENVSLRPYSCNSFIILPDPSERLRLLTYAFELFSANKIVGSGPLSYNLALGSGDRMFVYTYAHNVVADAAAKTGLVGLAILLVALWAMVVICLRAISRHFQSLYMACIPVLYLAGSMTGGDLYDTRVGWAIAGAIGGAYGWRAFGQKISA